MADRNVAVFIKGIVDFQKQAVTYSSRWDTLGNGLEGDLQRAQKALNDINGQLSKKKKLLKSKKYKEKIKLYSKSLDQLQAKLDSLAAELKTLRNDPATMSPSVVGQRHFERKPFQSLQPEA